METLEALQHEVDTLQNDKRELKEKIKQFSKKNLIEGIMTKQLSESSKQRKSYVFLVLILYSMLA